jgi:hypothetical protein
MSSCTFQLIYPTMWKTMNLTSCTVHTILQFLYCNEKHDYSNAVAPFFRFWGWYRHSFAYRFIIIIIIIIIIYYLLSPFYSVAAIRKLQLMLHVKLFSIINTLYFYISPFWSMCTRPRWLFFVVPWFRCSGNFWMNLKWWFQFPCYCAHARAHTHTHTEYLYYKDFIF